jgi:hypothetical protein
MITKISTKAIIKKTIIALGATLIMQTAFAGIHFKAANGADICQNLAGKWNGEGTVSASVVTCHYSGTAVVSPTLDPRSYTIDMDLNRDEGMICPDHKVIQMQGSCENNQLSIDTDDANLQGSVDESGTSASMTGFVYFDALGSRIKVNVEEMSLHKQ